MNIVIISASVRIGRRSHRIALFLENYIRQNQLASVQVLDLDRYQFPIFNERLSNLKAPPESARDFARAVDQADGVIIVTPEYNGGYPASLKNAIDLLYQEWKRKPVALATASYGPFGAVQVISSLVFSLWKIGAWLVPAILPGPNVQHFYDEAGEPADKEAAEARVKPFMDELLMCMEAKTCLRKTSKLIDHVS